MAFGCARRCSLASSAGEPRWDGQGISAVMQRLYDSVRCRPCWRSGDGRCAGNGWPINGQRGGELRFGRGADSHDVCAGEALRIGDELPLSMEVADRAVVDRGILAIALPRRRSLFRGERGRSMTEAGKRVQCRAAQGNDTVEHQAHGQLKLIRALTGQESTNPRSHGFVPLGSTSRRSSLIVV